MRGLCPSGGLLSQSSVSCEACCLRDAPAHSWLVSGAGRLGEQEAPAEGSVCGMAEKRRAAVCAAPAKLPQSQRPRESVSHRFPVCSPLPGRRKLVTPAAGTWDLVGRSLGPRDQPGTLEKGPHSCTLIRASIGVTSGPWTTKNRLRPHYQLCKENSGFKCKLLFCQVPKWCLDSLQPSELQQARASCPSPSLGV